MQFRGDKPLVRNADPCFRTWTSAKSSKIGPVRTGRADRHEAVVAARQRRERHARVGGRHRRVQAAVVQQQPLVQPAAAQLVGAPRREPNRPDHRLRATDTPQAARSAIAALKVMGFESYCHRTCWLRQMGASSRLVKILGWATACAHAKSLSASALPAEVSFQH